MFGGIVATAYWFSPRPKDWARSERPIASDHHIPIIFLTAYPDEDVRIRAMKAGAIRFMRKPCSDEHLLGYLNKAFKAA